MASGPLATADECRLPPWLESPMCVIRPPRDGGSRSTSTVAGPLIVLCEAAQQGWRLVDFDPSQLQPSKWGLGQASHGRS